MDKIIEDQMELQIVEIKKHLDKLDNLTTKKSNIESEIREIEASLNELKYQFVRFVKKHKITDKMALEIIYLL